MWAISSSQNFLLCYDFILHSDDINVCFFLSAFTSRLTWLRARPPVTNLLCFIRSPVPPMSSTCTYFLYEEEH
jgi:hypothetical protein